MKTGERLYRILFNDWLILALFGVMLLCLWLFSERVTIAEAIQRYQESRLQR